MLKHIKKIYRYREMIVSLVHRDLKGRYKGSVLGFLWTFINPLFQLVIYTMVFSVIMRNGIKDYYLFLFVALIPWIFFSSSLSGGCTCILGQQDMVKKIYFPREVLPIAFVTSQFVNMLLSFIIVFIALFIGHKPFNGLAYLFLPLIMIIEYIMALGLTFMFSAITVYLRDVQWIMNIITMAWQFLTPVMYSIKDVPEQVRWVFNINPMTGIINSYRNILYYGTMPELNELGITAVLGIVILFIGYYVLKKLERRFAEIM